MVIRTSHPKLDSIYLCCCLFRAGWEVLNRVSYALYYYQIKMSCCYLGDVFWCFLEIWILISCSYFQGAKENYVLTNTVFKHPQISHDIWKHVKKYILGRKVFSLWLLFCCFPLSSFNPQNSKLIFNQHKSHLNTKWVSQRLSFHAVFWKEYSLAIVAVFVKGFYYLPQGNGKPKWTLWATGLRQQQCFLTAEYIGDLFQRPQ